MFFLWGRILSRREEGGQKIEPTTIMFTPVLNTVNKYTNTQLIKVLSISQRTVGMRHRYIIYIALGY